MAQLTEAVESLINIGQRPDLKILTAIVCSLQTNCDGGEASAHDVINVLQGLAALGFQPTGPVLDQVCYYLRGRLEECTSDDISRYCLCIPLIFNGIFLFSTIMSSLPLFKKKKFTKVNFSLRKNRRDFAELSIGPIFANFSILEFYFLIFSMEVEICGPLAK